MAKAPRDPNAPKRSRKMKASKVFFMYKGEITEHKVVKSSDEALDIKDTDNAWNYVRFEVPKARKAAPDAPAS